MLSLVILLVFIALLAVWGHGKLSKRSRGSLPPGPLLNMTPIVGHLPFMTSTPHLKLCELAKRHGDVFTIRLGSYDIVVINSLSLIRQCFAQTLYSNRPNYLLAMNTSKHGITFATGSVANEQRKFILKTLRDFGFGKSCMETLVHQEVQELVRHLREKEVHSLSNIFGLSVINALWRVLANRKFKLDDEYAKGVYDTVIEGFIDPPVSGAVWFLPLIAKLLPRYTGYRKVMEAVDKLKCLVDKVVLEHKAEYERTGLVNDFVDAYLERIKCEEDETSSFYGDLGMTNLTHTLIDLFTAGSDTLNSTLNFAIRYLCQHPDIQDEIHSELDSVIMTSDDIPTVPYSIRDQLPLLDATITETLRLSSIVTNGILHSTAGPATIQNYNLPKDTIVMPNLYWVHHNPELWDEPERFNPRRFFGKEGAAKQKQCMAFSAGKRVCIAEQMAQVEMFCFLGGLLANFKFEGVELGRVKSGLVLNVEGLKVKVIPRRKVDLGSEE